MKKYVIFYNEKCSACNEKILELKRKDTLKKLEFRVLQKENLKTKKFLIMDKKNKTFYYEKEAVLRIAKVIPNYWLMIPLILLSQKKQIRRYMDKKRFSLNFVWCREDCYLRENEKIDEVVLNKIYENDEYKQYEIFEKEYKVAIFVKNDEIFGLIEKNSKEIISFLYREEFEIKNKNIEFMETRKLEEILVKIKTGEIE